MTRRFGAVHASWADVPAADWDALVGDESPFLEHAFLCTAEETGGATAKTGWTPRPVLVWDDPEDGGPKRLVGGAPAWIKTHSMGEFVYDHAFANAAERAGIRYYPKWVVAAPFSPVTGRRVLAADADARTAVLATIDAAAHGRVSGVHHLFDLPEEAVDLEQRGYFTRLQYQFHWKNHGYASFDDFLRQAFKSDTRNKIRRERKEVAHLRVSVEMAPPPDVLDAIHGFYRNTAAQFGPWGHVYLSADAFRKLGERWGHRLQAVVARDGDRIVGGSLNIVKGDRLYGRYWGCSEEIRFLHFEVCYYAAIDWCIANRIAVFEPGHGGEHKYRRGFEPTITYSSHKYADPRLHEAFERYCAEEGAAVREAVRAATTD